MVTRTATELVGSATITLAAFGLGPLLGLWVQALQLPTSEIVTFAPPSARVTWEAPTDMAEVAPSAPASAPVEPPPEPNPPAVPVTAAVARPGPPAPKPADRLAVPVAPESPVARKARRCESERENPAIRRDARGVFQVDDDLVGYYTSHLGALNRLGWSRQHDGPDGKADGMFIGGVGCGSDLHLAGIRSGDVVHAVNGRRVRSIPEALWVYRAVRNDRVIEVEISRRGKRQVLVYTLT